MGISFVHRGDFRKTEKLLKKSLGINYRDVLEKYAQQGVAALSSATPVNTGLAASSWGYEIIQNGSSISIIWTNSDIENGFPVAIMLQYGHATRGGGYVQGIDYINPALRPIFSKLAEAAWKEVTSL